MMNIAKFGQKYIFAASAAAKCISVLTLQAPLSQNNRHEAQLQGLNAEKHTNNNNNETEREFHNFPELPFIHFGRCVSS